MPTAPSSTETSPPFTPVRVGTVAAARRAVEDVGILFHFRRQAIRRRHVVRALFAIPLTLTLGAAVIPALVPSARVVRRTPSTSSC